MSGGSICHNQENAYPFDSQFFSSMDLMPDEVEPVSQSIIFGTTDRDVLLLLLLLLPAASATESHGFVRMRHR